MKPEFLKTTNSESFKSWWFRTLMNWYPMYFGSGGKILFWAGDSTELHLRLKLNVWSYNYVGTIFGGSMFSASDPFYMLMLLRALGPKYVVWDKSAIIRFRKPARTTLYAILKITQSDFEEIKTNVADKGEFTKTFTIRWMDQHGVAHAEIERLCYIADKVFYVKKKGDTQSAKLKFKIGKDD
jgi:Domain of unknown function (DUF4442)